MKPMFSHDPDYLPSCDRDDIPEPSTRLIKSLTMDELKVDMNTIPPAFLYEMGLVGTFGKIKHNDSKLDMKPSPETLAYWQRKIWRHWLLFCRGRKNDPESHCDQLAIIAFDAACLWESMQHIPTDESKVFEAAKEFMR